MANLKAASPSTPIEYSNGVHTGLVNDKGRQAQPTNNDDFIVGSDQGDEIHAKGGADDVRGRADNDTLYGDDGNDSLYGQEGDDLLVGGHGADWLVGDTPDGSASAPNAPNEGNVASGDDTLVGGNGNDTYVGGLGADTFAFKAGDDNDTIRDFNNVEKITTPDIAGDRAVQEQGDTIEIYDAGAYSTSSITGFGEGGTQHSLITYGGDVSGQDTIRVLHTTPDRLENGTADISDGSTGVNSNYNFSDPTIDNDPTIADWLIT